MKILIADKNKRVGEFLKRELEKDFHKVYLADTGYRVMDRIQGDHEFDLLIIDPDLPDMEIPVLFQSVLKERPDMPVIIHTYQGDNSWEGKKLQIVASVEKKGNSIDSIKNAIVQFTQSVNC